MKFSTLVTSAAALTATTVLGEQWRYTNELVEEPSTAKFTLTDEILGQAGGMDAPMVSPRPNRTAFDWWYFDAHNPNNLHESVVIILSLTTNDSFPLVHYKTTSVSVDLFFNFADGSAVPVPLDAYTYRPSEPVDVAVINSTDNGVNATWAVGGLISFDTTEDGMHIDLKFIHNGFGINGTISFEASSNSHFPCSEKGKPGESLEALPHVGWNNMMPSAKANVSASLANRSAAKRIAFTDGVGYHDHKWSDQPFHKSVKDWNWGHATLGQYSIVWLESVTQDGKKYTNGYIYNAKDKSTRVSCENEQGGAEIKNVKINDSEDSTEITFSYCEEETFTMSVGKDKVIGTRGPFTRWTGHTSATMKHGEQLEGTALFQQFHFGPYTGDA